MHLSENDKIEQIDKGGKSMSNMVYLAPLMLEKVGIIVIVAFLLSRINSFRQIVDPDQIKNRRVQLVLLFGVFGVISNYTGIEVYNYTVNQAGWLYEVDPDSAIANTRVMGVVIAGLVGGRAVGLGTGLIAGIHRYTLGGFTAVSCSLSTVIAGIAAGYIRQYLVKKKIPVTPAKAAIAGMSLEALQMVIILATAKPFTDALALVQFISLPMITLNGLGTFLFMYIVQTIRRDEELTRATQTNQAFLIADKTLPYFRQGLNPDSCNEVSRIMLQLTDADAVAITNTKIVLSHLGAGSDHHRIHSRPETKLTEAVLKTGVVSVAQDKSQIHCTNEDCPLAAAIVLPLKIRDKIVGTLKLYYTDREKLDIVQQQLAEGLANLFATQLELAEAENQAKLLKDAEIMALQAQIHPHFLFNSLNTISALCRTNPEKARNLLLELSHFFRSNLHGARHVLIPVEKELENLKAYLSIVQTRFPDKYLIEYDIDPGVNNILIPPFTLQPLVENAVNHAFLKKKRPGHIKVQLKLGQTHLEILVSDDGVGIPEDRLRQIGNQPVKSAAGTGTALFNIRERLDSIFHSKAELKVISSENKGTSIFIQVPHDSKGVALHDDQNLYRG